MFGLGFGEVLVIALAILIVFGPNKIPEIARNLAKGIRAFRNATDDIKREVYSATSEVQKSIFTEEVKSSIPKDILPNLDLENDKPDSKFKDLDNQTGPISRK